MNERPSLIQSELDSTDNIHAILDAILAQKLLVLFSEQEIQKEIAVDSVREVGSVVRSLAVAAVRRALRGETPLPFKVNRDQLNDQNREPDLSSNPIEIVVFLGMTPLTQPPLRDATLRALASWKPPTTASSVRLVVYPVTTSFTETAVSSEPAIDTRLMAAGKSIPFDEEGISAVYAANNPPSQEASLFATKVTLDWSMEFGPQKILEEISSIVVSHTGEPTIVMPLALYFPATTVKIMNNPATPAGTQSSDTVDLTFYNPMTKDLTRLGIPI